MTWSNEDIGWMQQALALAERGLRTASPNPRVGCVIVRDGCCVGQGWHQRTGGPHAEVFALNQAGELAQGATAYVTLEPCSHWGRTDPCADGLIAAQIKRVVVAMQDPNSAVDGRGIARLRQAGITVETGLLMEQAQQLNVGFISRMARQRPWLRLKMALSLDGRTAMANGQSQWITGPAAREDGHYWRSRADAILTGIGTVQQDNPQLTVRSNNHLAEQQPLRIILDSELNMSLQAAILDTGPCLVLTGQASDGLAADKLRHRGVEVMSLPVTPQGIDLMAVMGVLKQRQFNEIHVECGAVLAGALLEQQLIDEMIIYMAPVLLGDNSRGLAHTPFWQHMEQRLPLAIQSVRAVGQDWRWQVTPRYPVS